MSCRRSILVFRCSATKRCRMDVTGSGGRGLPSCPLGCPGTGGPLIGTCLSPCCYAAVPTLLLQRAALVRVRACRRAAHGTHDRPRARGLSGQCCRAGSTTVHGRVSGTQFVTSGGTRLVSMLQNLVAWSTLAVQLNPAPRLSHPALYATAREPAAQRLQRNLGSGSRRSLLTALRTQPTACISQCNAPHRKAGAEPRARGACESVEERGCEEQYPKEERAKVSRNQRHGYKGAGGVWLAAPRPPPATSQGSRLGQRNRHRHRHRSRSRRGAARHNARSLTCQQPRARGALDAPLHSPEGSPYNTAAIRRQRAARHTRPSRRPRAGEPRVRPAHSRWPSKTALSEPWPSKTASAEQ
jgi:hypothetical protein